MKKNDLSSWLSDVAMDIEALETREALLHWRYATTGHQQTYSDLQQNRRRLRSFFADDHRLTLIDRIWHEQRQRLDRDTSRQIEGLYARHVMGHVDDEALVQEVCQTKSPESLVRLVRYRNERARILGYPDYYAMVLAANDLDERWGELVFHTLANSPVSKLPAQPDDGSDEAMEIGPAPKVVEGVAKYFDAIGLRIGDVLARSRINFGAADTSESLVFHVDKLDDVRIVIAVDNAATTARKFVETIGIAVYLTNIFNFLPYLLRRPTHGIAMQTSALLFGRLLGNSEWLNEWFGFSQAAAKSFSERWKLQEVQKQRTLVERTLGMMRLEQKAYRSEGQSLPGLGALGSRAYLDFALKPLTHYYDLLAEITASALHQALERELGSGALVSSPAAGYFLIDQWYCHGARYRWDELCERTFRHLGNLETLLQGANEAL